MYILRRKKFDSLLQMQKRGKSADANLFIIRIIVWWDIVNRTSGEPRVHTGGNCPTFLGFGMG
jgi:hypothetical protein